LPPSPLAPAAAPQTPDTPGKAKFVVPDHLLTMDDRALIVVNGKPTPVIEIKRELASELRRQSGTPRSASTSRSTARASKAPMKHPGGQFKPTFPAGSLTPPPGPRIQTTVVPGVTTSMRVRQEEIYNPKTYCRTHAPAIMGIQGVLTPNQRITIDGVCFGDHGGEIQVIGQFAGGNMKLAFERWADGEIVAFVPAVRGAADHSVAVTVVRADRTRSTAAQAEFVAARERVEVPAHYWNPNESFSHTEIADGGGNILTGYVSHGASAGSFSTPFSISINKACGLDNVVWTSTVGRIDRLSGWEAGPPNQADISVEWTPRCITHSKNYIFASVSQRVCSVEFNLKAWAACPVGVAP
jgi:hypothetical protein